MKPPWDEQGNDAVLGGGTDAALTGTTVEGPIDDVIKERNVAICNVPLMLRQLEHEFKALVSPRSLLSGTVMAASAVALPESGTTAAPVERAVSPAKNVIALSAPCPWARLEA